MQMSFASSVRVTAARPVTRMHGWMVLGWERYVGSFGRIIGMKTFGASAPLKELQVKFGFEPDRVVEVAKELSEKEQLPDVKGRNIA